MPETMRVARLHAAGDVRVREEPAPVAGPDETLVRVDAVGLCGSDLHWFEQGGIGDAVVSSPVVPGHEIAGTALDGPHRGRLVAVDPAIPCGSCALCLEGHRNLCPDVAFAGHGTLDGGMREVMPWPTRLLTPLPHEISAAAGACLEPLGVALHAWDLAHSRVGDTVGVVGCGPIGLLMVQLARVAGANHVVAVEPLAHRREAAARLGADVVVEPSELAPGHARGAVPECNVVFEVCGDEAAVAGALSLARPGARVVLVGIPNDDRTQFSAGLARRKGLTLVLVRRMKEMYTRTVALVASGRVEVDTLVTARFGLDAVDQAFRTAAARGGLKTVVVPSARDADLHRSATVR